VRSHLPYEGEICLLCTSNEIFQNPHGLPGGQACRTSSIQPVLRTAVVTPRMAFTCTLPCYQKCCFLNSCREPHVAQQYRPRALAMPDSGNLDQHPHCTDLSGAVCGTRCYFAEDNRKPPGHSAPVFKAISQAQGMHASCRRTTTGDSISDLFAQLVRSLLVPEQKPQTFGWQIRRAINGNDDTLWVGIQQRLKPTAPKTFGVS